ncbi:molybdopterin molybdenumtransferase MoeA, partial [Paraburkholderia sp. Ac-20347]|nr:molybdopterin molybdenumtransferase MoeA [Paraburkholderia sp. Ac-20347]
MSTPQAPNSGTSAATNAATGAPRPPMISTADALATLLAAAQPLTQTETLSTFDALNRVLAVEVVSPLDVPPMNTSAMDGYAVRAADLHQGSRRLPVSQRIPAGHAPQPLAAGTAARIFTGAPVPPGI